MRAQKPFVYKKNKMVDLCGVGRVAIFLTVLMPLTTPLTECSVKYTKHALVFFDCEMTSDHFTNNFTGCRGSVSSKLVLKAYFFMIFHGFCCGILIGWQKWRLWAIPNFLRPALWQFWQIIPQSYQIRRNFGCVIFLIRDSAAQSQVIGLS